MNGDPPIEIPGSSEIQQMEDRIAELEGELEKQKTEALGDIRRVGEWKQKALELEAKYDAAVADNAAYHKVFCRWFALGKGSASEIAEMLKQDHPGEALLERLAALERVEEAARLGHYRLLEDALAALDKVKNRKPCPVCGSGDWSCGH